MQASNEDMDSKPDGVLNSSRICRFCLSPAGVMSPIFEQGEFNSLPLSSKIMAFISIQVYVNDGLPSLICHRCLYQVEKSYDFKTQCEASDAMLRKYLSSFQSPRSPRGGALGVDNSENFVPSFDSFNLAQFQKSLLHGSSFSDSPFKRKRGRPRKEENMMFYSSPLHSHIDFSNGVPSYPDDEIKIVDGIESLVTVVDPRSEILSNSDDENKVENENGGESDKNDGGNVIEEGMDSLAIAKAKAKKYMGVIIGVDENGMRTRRHLCKGCGKTFGHCSDLRKHVLVHTGERPFHCRVCTKTFSRSTNLNKHMKVHTGQKPYFCTDCPKSFATKGDLQRHLIIHSGVKPFGCHLCNQCFSRKDKLTRHLKLHETGGITKVKCNLCSAVCHSDADLKQHVESLHPQDVKNEEEEDDEGDRSDEASGSKERLDLKEEESSLDKDLVIKQEKEDSLQDGEANPEIESMVINIDPFQMDSDLNDTLVTWENEKIRNDVKTKANDYSNKIDDSKSLNYLIKNEGTEKPTFQCKICYKKFSELAYLRSHMVTHSAVKPHKCTMCEKSFTRRRELLRHENVHTGFKPFKCNTCGKAFSRKDKLVRHEKIHNGVKKFPCTICPTLVFTKVEDLLFHHRSAHSEREIPYVLPSNPQLSMKYQCETCFVCYGNLKMYQDHVKTHEDKNSSQEKLNGVDCDSENGNSAEEKLANSSLEQLNSNPAITVTSISKSSARERHFLQLPAQKGMNEKRKTE